MTSQTPTPQDSKEAVLGRMTDAVFALDSDWRFTYLNERTEELLDADESDLLGEPVWDAFPEARGTTFYREYRRAVSEQEPVSFEEYFDPLETWFSVRAFPSESGLTVYFRDVTDAHNRRVELERERKRLAVRDRFDEVFSDVSRLGTTATTGTEFQQRLVDRLHRIDGVHAVRIDDVDVEDGTVDTHRRAGSLDFGSTLPEPFVTAVDRRDVVRIPASQLDFDLPETVCEEIVFAPLVTEDTVHSVLTLAVDDSLRTHVDDSLFHHLVEIVGCVVENLSRREQWRSVARVFEQLDAGAYVVGTDGEIVWANDSFAEYLGIDLVDVVGSDHERFVERRLGPIFADTDRLRPRLLDPDPTADGTRSSTFRVSEGYDRSERTLEHEVHSVDAGRFEGGTAHVFHDVTDKAETEQSLAEAEWFRASLLDSFPGMVYRCRNTEGWDMDYVSGRVESLTGYDAETLRSTVSWGETVVDPRDRADVWDSVQSQLADGDTFELTYRIVRRDGTRRWVWERGQRVDTPDGKRLAGFVSDVTEKHEVKDRLQREEDRFQSLVEHVSEYAIFTMNRQGCVESWNDGAESITGYSTDEATGMHLSSFVPDEHDDRFLPESHMTEATLRGEAHGEGWLQASDGERFWARVVLRAVTDDDNDVTRFVAVVRDMTEQRQRRRELEHQRDELVTLNRINTVVRDIDRALVQARTRHEICSAICDRLTDDDRYSLAWIGESDHARNVVNPIEWAGVGADYVEGLEVSLEGERGVGPVGRSLRTESVAVTQRITEDPQFEPWRAAALEHGFRSSASVPIEYGGVQYGVLCVYSGEAGAFDEREKQLLAELGEMVGYAFNAVDRKQALVEDSMTELTVELTDSLSEITELTEQTDGSVTITSTVETADGAFLQYLRTEDVDPTAVAEILEDMENVRSAEVLWNRETSGSLSVYLDAAPFTQTIGVYGGRLDSVVAHDGIITADIRFPVGANIRSVTEQLRELYPDLELVAKRTIAPENEAQRLATLVEDELTDRQAKVLETAYHAGYYEWPRDTNGTELAAQLDLSGATLSQHLRAAHKKIVGSVVEQRLR